MTPTKATMKKILIAEDDAPMCRALMLKLKSAGYDVKTVADGVEAIDTLKKNDFDVLLLDLIMPKKDGFSVLQEMKENKIKTTVLVLTNLGQDEDRKKVESLGAAGYYVKSDTPLSEIITIIKGHV